MRAQEKSLEAFLFTPNRYFLIPDFQRPYSWEKKQIKVFLEDIENVIKSSSRHYFGGVVYINRDFHNEIIDGQQRVTTSIIFITAIYHLLKKHPKKSNLPAEQIKNQYLWNEYGQEENKMKLKSIVSDNEIFEDIFNQNEIIGDKRLSRVYQAYSQFINHLHDKENLDHYLNAIRKFDIVEISLDVQNDAPRKIFESINSTGKPLSDGDKIRNFVLMSDDRIRDTVFKKFWKKIESSLMYYNQDHISDFFRYYLITVLQREVKIDNVYDEFKRHYYEFVGYSFDEDKTILFYEEILLYLKYYLLLKFKVHNENLSFLKREVFRLNYLQLDVVFSFLMKVLYKFDKEKMLDEKEVKNIFKTLESFIVRRLICKINTTGLNKFFPILDKDVQQMVEKNIQISYLEAFNYLIGSRKGQTRFPKNDEVENGVRENDVYNQRKFNLTFILTSVDDEHSREANLLEANIDNDAGFSIEHIMPQKLTGKYGEIWKEDLGGGWKDVHEKWLNTLPNLTLTAYNSTYSNRDFHTKKTIENGFSESPLKINEFIRKQEIWNEENLEKRARWWMDVINNIWPEPVLVGGLSEDKIEKDIYSLADQVSFTNTKPDFVYILGEEYKFDNWSGVFEKILTVLYEEDNEIFEEIIKKSFYTNYVTPDKEQIRKAGKITNSNIYYEQNTNTDLKVRILRNLLEDLEYDLEEIKFKIEK